MKQDTVIQMMIQGYRVYAYSGQPSKRMFIEMVKLEQFPKLIFIKNKKLDYGI